MISQLFALPLRALVVAAALPTHSAMGAPLPHSALHYPAIAVPLGDAGPAIPTSGKPHIRTHWIVSAADSATR